MKVQRQHLNAVTENILITYSPVVNQLQSCRFLENCSIKKYHQSNLSKLHSHDWKDFLRGSHQYSQVFFRQFWTVCILLNFCFQNGLNQSILQSKRIRGSVAVVKKGITSVGYHARKSKKPSFLQYYSFFINDNYSKDKENLKRN